MYLEAVLEIALQGSSILKTKCTEKQRVHGTHKPAGLSNLPSTRRPAGNSAIFYYTFLQWFNFHMVFYI